MVKETSKKGLKIKELLLEIGSGNLTRIRKGIKSLKIHGDSSVIQPLLAISLQTDDDATKNEIWNFMNDLSDSDAKQAVIDCLNKGQFESIKTALLHSMWNSKLDYSDYLDEIVSIAIAGDFIVALECLTIIENLNGPFDESKVMEAQLTLANSLKKENNDKQKKCLMSDLAIILKKFDRLVD